MIVNSNSATSFTCTIPNRYTCIEWLKEKKNIKKQPKKQNIDPKKKSLNKEITYIAVIVVLIACVIAIILGGGISLSINNSIKYFIENIKDYVSSRLSNGQKVVLQSVTKNNGLVYDGLFIVDPILNVSPTIYLNPYYHLFYHLFLTLYDSLPFFFRQVTLVFPKS